MDFPCPRTDPYFLFSIHFVCFCAASRRPFYSLVLGASGRFFDLFGVSWCNPSDGFIGAAISLNLGRRVTILFHGCPLFDQVSAPYALTSPESRENWGSSVKFTKDLFVQCKNPLVKRTGRVTHLCIDSCYV
jgi:hypothetical protein